MKSVIKDLKSIENVLKTIAVPKTDSLEDVLKSVSHFESLAEQLKKLCEESEKRNRAREEENKKVEGPSRKFVSSSIVKEKCEKYIPVLEKFVETRKAIVANCQALVSFDFEALKANSQIPYPSDNHIAILPVFGDIHQMMRSANERLTGQIRKSLADQTIRLERLGINASDYPPCIAALLNRSRMDRVFACDTLDPLKMPPNATRKERQGEYDTIFGMEEFAYFLTDLASVSPSLELHPIDGVPRPEPELVQALRLYGQLARFTKSCATDDVTYLLTLSAPGGNKLQALVSHLATLRGKRSMLVDMWWNRSSGSLRENIIAKGAAFALDAGEKLGEDEIAEFSQLMGEWKKEIESLDRRIKSDPYCVEEVRTKILEMAIPGLSSARAMRHWADEAKIKGGGR